MPPRWRSTADPAVQTYRRTAAELDGFHGKLAKISKKQETSVPTERGLAPQQGPRHVPPSAGEERREEGCQARPRCSLRAGSELGCIRVRAGSSLGLVIGPSRFYGRTKSQEPPRQPRRSQNAYPRAGVQRTRSSARPHSPQNRAAQRRPPHPGPEDTLSWGCPVFRRTAPPAAVRLSGCTPLPRAHHHTADAARRPRPRTAAYGRIRMGIRTVQLGSRPHGRTGLQEPPRAPQRDTRQRRGRLLG